MKCPACHEYLRVRPYRKKDFNYCDDCEGLWLDSESVKESGLSSVLAAPQTESSRECPQCYTSLQLSRVDKTKIELDSCPQCQGVWFDKGELKKMKGNIDQLNWEELGADLKETLAGIVSFLRFISNLFSLFSRF